LIIAGSVEIMLEMINYVLIEPLITQNQSKATKLQSKLIEDLLVVENGESKNCLSTPDYVMNFVDNALVLQTLNVCTVWLSINYPIPHVIKPVYKVLDKIKLIPQFVFGAI
jgi:hypothetical protein